MVRYKCKFEGLLLVILLFLAYPAVSAETWHLDQDGDWKPVEAQGRDKYLLAVAQIKELINKGKTQAVKQAWDQLKESFPEINGPDLEAFIEAEVLFTEGKFVKAVRVYDRFLARFPESKLYQAALDRQFTIANAFLAGRKKTVLGFLRIRGYAEGEKIMDKITDRAGNAPIGIEAAIAVAKSYEKREKFEQAYQQWSLILSKWPTGQIGEDALLAMARCKYSAYRGPKYDVSDLLSAKSYYENFRLKYPKDAAEIGVDKRIENINELLAEKQFNIAQYYRKTGNPDSADISYRRIVDKWPQSSAAKIADKKIAEIDLELKRLKK